MLVCAQRSALGHAATQQQQHTDLQKTNQTAKASEAFILKMEVATYYYYFYYCYYYYYYFYYY